ncbi:uncharacterized protein BDZ99DRAFT_479939 [Mytilinidion resinicola]|uniref:Uncharacterized protein n=1 Tax=Mytilinidion resinicola TaxID=574789 RepID=A0A6A6YBG4_9PEZI|nr:uncharacterized protein BDZ99DRAFT_479939 [Mytilinidion resinicola]KAF2805918.1 hypothetical protein BDZ99DRAFT_479939 [Mytilinidion resinicola]
MPESLGLIMLRRVALLILAWFLGLAEETFEKDIKITIFPGSEHEFGTHRHVLLPSLSLYPKLKNTVLTAFQCDLAIVTMCDTLTEALRGHVQRVKELVTPNPP